MSSVLKRRSFVARLAGLAAAGAASLTPHAAAAEEFQDERRAEPELGPEKWELSWIDELKGRHKLVFDLLWHNLRTNSLNPPRNFLDVQKQLYGLEFPDVNVVIGMNSSSFGINASDSLWAKYKLGERYKIQDPTTRRPAERNVYLGSDADKRAETVRALQARGVVFMMCNKALNGMSSDYARELGRSKADVYAELVAGLNPGVRVVPALTWALCTLQEHGFTYAKL